MYRSQRTITAYFMYNPKFDQEVNACSESSVLLVVAYRNVEKKTTVNSQKWSRSVSRSFANETFTSTSLNQGFKTVGRNWSSWVGRVVTRRASIEFVTSRSALVPCNKSEKTIKY